MTEQQPVTLFVGNDSESNKAIKAVQDAGINSRVFDRAVGQFDFDTPLLISAWGVFEGLNSIIWFTRIALQHDKPNMDSATSDEQIPTTLRSSDQRGVS